MDIIKEIGFLLRKELLLEWRTRYAISGILLYVLSTVFLVYQGFFGNVQAQTWNVVFWIVILFASINAMVKSFTQESSSRRLYYYQLVNPVAVILSKMIYNVGLLFVISLLAYAGFALFLENPVKDAQLFFMALFLGSAGFAITFTFTSAIANKANNTSTLMAILSFPLIIPIILELIKISANALRLITDTSISADLWILVAIDLLLLGLAIVLFPFLWRD